MDALGHGRGLPHFHEHVVGHFSKLRQHVVGEGANLHAVLVHQLPEGGVVARRVLREHIFVDGPRGHFDDGLEIIGKRFEGLLIHERFHDRAGLLPARVVVVLRHRVQAEGEVVVGPHPVRGVDGARLQRRIHIAPGHGHGFAAGALEYLAPEARNAHAQPLHVGQGFDFLIEPAAHLRARIAAGEGDEAEGRVELLPQFKPAAIVEPAVHFLSRQPKGHGGEEGGLGHLAAPVVSGAVAHFRIPGEHRIEYLESANEFSRAVDLNLQAPVGHTLHKLRELFRRRPQGRQVLRPGGNELPFIALAFRRRTGCAGLITPGAGAKQPRDHH